MVKTEKVGSLYLKNLKLGGHHTINVNCHSVKTFIREVTIPNTRFYGGFSRSHSLQDFVFSDTYS